MVIRNANFRNIKYDINKTDNEITNFMGMGFENIEFGDQMSPLTQVYGYRGAYNKIIAEYVT